MTELLILLAGVALAAPLFAAMLWSAAQALRHPGARRVAHLVAIAATFAVMAFLTWEFALPARAAGVILALAGLRLLFMEEGWTRLLPLVQLAAGAVVAAGLPFAG
jgi:hypothetical protein